MIIGIILLIFALIQLRMILWWIVLLTLGLLCVSGFFDRPLKDLIRYCKKECWWKKKTVTSSAKSAEKEVSKTSRKK
jgi:hypothetical protein